MKVYINRSPKSSPWGGGNMWVKSAHDILPSLGISLVNLEDSPDVIVAAGIGPEDNHPGIEQLILHKSKSSKLVFRVNDNDARKGTTGVDDAIRYFSKHCDSVVFVSEWLRNYFSASGEGIEVMHNGVDSSIFRERPKLSNGKINIVTHHWSDNYMKGFDVYDVLDKWIEKRPDFTFTYIGRHRGSFKNSTTVEPLYGMDLGEELSKYDVYVSASRHDPGPNHIIESLSCKIPTYVHKDGGGCVEFAGKDHAYESIDHLLYTLERKSYIQNTAWSPPAWQDCMTKFAHLLKAIK